jgi:hypothetical protein
MAEQRLGHVRWDGFGHRHMWNMIMDARPDDVFERHERWTKLGASLAEVNTAVQQTLNSLFESWRGSAAITAALSNTHVLGWAQEAAESVQQVGEQLGHYGNALVEARNRMPQPRHVYYERTFRAGDGATVLNGPENTYTLLQLADDQMYTLQERREAKQRAVEVMQAFEANAIDVRQQLGTIPPLHGSIDPDGDGGSDDPSLIPSPGPGGVPPSWRPLPGDAGPAPTGSMGADPSFAGSGAGSGGVGGAGGYGPGTGALGMAGTGADAVTGGRGPGGPFTGMAGPRGVGAGASAMGRGVGALPGQGVGAEAAARGAGAGARGGGAFYPPFGGAGGGEDDRDKPLAPYLVAEDDLFDDDRVVAPPVFGA